MSLLFISNGLLNNFVQAFGWTLVHSIWQGLALSVIAAIVITFTKRSGPAVRYNLLSALGILFLLTAGVTFIMELQTGSPQTALTLSPGKDLHANAIQAQAILLENNEESWAHRFTFFFNRYDKWIVLAWFVFFLLKFIRLLTSFNYVTDLKNKHSHPVERYWQERVEQLASTLRISRPVQFLESMVVTVPIVLGYLKPVIIFPIGLLSNIPPEQAEAILLHELAHIKRKDWLINLLQHLTESIFFFNPAILWLSSVLRQERENCCDAIAIAKTNNKINYVKALISFQEYQPEKPQPAIGLYDTTPHLLHRVKRILNNNNKTLNAMEKTFLTTGIVLTALMALRFSPGVAVPNENNTGMTAIERLGTIHKKDQPAILLTDTLPNKKKVRQTGDTNFTGTIINTIDGKEYKIEVKNEKITELYIDGKRIPDEKLGEYKEMVDKIITETKQQAEFASDEAAQARMEAENVRKQAGVYREQAERLRSQNEDNQKAIELQRQQIENAKTDAEKERLLAEYNLSKVKSNQKDIQGEKERMEKENTVLQEYRERANMDRERAEGYRKETELQRGRSEEYRKQAETYRAKAEVQREESQKLVKAIVEDLIAEKVIKDKNDLRSFFLGNDEFIVNGVKQPEAIHRKFKEKYVKGKDWHFNFNGSLEYINNINIKTNIDSHVGATIVL